MNNQNFSGKELLKIAKNSNIDINGINPNELEMGYKVELEHGSVDKDTNVTDDDIVKTIKIAIAHLREKGDYYTLLNKYVENKKEDNMINESANFKRLAGISSSEDKEYLVSENFKDNIKETNIIFENFEKVDFEVRPSNFQIGDLIFAKNEGHSGLVGLVISDPYLDDNKETVQDVLFRGYRGDVLQMYVDELVDLLDGNLDVAINKGDIQAYKSIALKKGIELNPKYQEAEDEYNTPDLEEDIIELDEDTNSYEGSRKDFKVKLDNFEKAFRELNDMWINNMDQSIDEDLITEYPFNESFDEVYLKVLEWVNDFNRK